MLAYKLLKDVLEFKKNDIFVREGNGHMANCVVVQRNGNNIVTLIEDDLFYNREYFKEIDYDTNKFHRLQLAYRFKNLATMYFERIDDKKKLYQELQEIRWNKTEIEMLDELFKLLDSYRT